MKRKSLDKVCVYFVHRSPYLGRLYNYRHTLVSVDSSPSLDPAPPSNAETEEARNVPSASQAESGKVGQD